MTRNHLETAMRERIPFMIKMTDGEKYEVTENHQIALGKTHAVLVDEHDLPHVLPLLTMTGISYMKARKKRTR